MSILGLDNGIYVKSNKRKITRETLPNVIKYPFDEDYDGEVEIAYWRKCWGIRNEIINTFNDGKDDCKFTIDTPEQVSDLIKLVASWLDEKKWNEEADSIWEYDEIKDTLVTNVVNLSIVYLYMVSKPDVYLEFYDSY